MTNLRKAAVAAEHMTSHLMLTPACEEGTVTIRFTDEARGR